METAGLSHEIRQQGPVTAEENPQTRAIIAFTSLTTRSRALDLLSRYETRYDRQFCRALDRFSALRLTSTAKQSDEKSDSAIRPREINENKQR